MSFHKLRTVVSLLLLLAASDLLGQGAPYRNFWAYTDRRFPYRTVCPFQAYGRIGCLSYANRPEDRKVTSVTVLKSTGWTYLDEAAARTTMRWRARPNAPRSDVTVPITFGSSAQSR